MILLILSFFKNRCLLHLDACLLVLKFKVTFKRLLCFSKYCLLQYRISLQNLSTIQTLLERDNGRKIEKKNKNKKSVLKTFDLQKKSQFVEI